MSLSDAIRKLFNTDSSQQTKVTRLNVLNVDASSVRPIPVPDKNQSLKLTLEIPYERHDMRIPQIKKEVMEMYSKLADFIDKQLRGSGTSLPQLHNQLARDGGYYDNILYTIYCIAEGEVTTHYKPSNGYDNHFSYKLLREHMGEREYENVKQFTKEYCTRLPEPDEETRTAYHLTSNGLESLWWDMDGFIREKYSISESQAALLNRTTSRSTQVLKVAEVRAHVLVQYLSTLAVLRHEFTNTEGWTKKMSRHLDGFFNQKSHYWYGSDDIRVTGYILKICEQTVRQNIPYTRLLKTDDEIAHLRRVLPKASRDVVIESATKLGKTLNLSSDAVELLRKQNPHAWKQDVAELKNADTVNCIKTLNYYRSDEAFNRIAKEAIKNTDGNNQAQLIAFYSYYSTLPEGKGDWATRQKLFKLIPHPEQQKTFDQLVAGNKHTLNTDLVKTLMALTKPPVRIVSLDPNKLSTAHGEHEEALKKVSSYLGDDKEPEQPVTPDNSKKNISADDLFSTIKEDDDIELTTDQLEFIKMIVEYDWSLPVAKAEIFTKSRHKLLRGFIQEFNKNVYTHIEDQLIIQDDVKITVDETYKSFVKEILNARDTA